VHGARQRKDKTQICTRGASKMRQERKAGFYFSGVIFPSFFFLCLVNSASPESARLLEGHSKWTQELWGLTLSFCFQGKLVKNNFIGLAPRRILPFLFPLFLFWKRVDSSAKRRHQKTWERKMWDFLFSKDAISSLRLQGYASEAVSCCILCCLFDASQLNYAPCRKL